MEREIHIWHDAHGKILAWGFAPSGKLKAQPITRPEHGVITARVTESELKELHESHHVDSANKKLVAR